MDVTSHSNTLENVTRKFSAKNRQKGKLEGNSKLPTRQSEVTIGAGVDGVERDAERKAKDQHTWQR
jgi:hypothetical protein